MRNDERTRTFLTMEVSAGHHEVNVPLPTIESYPIVTKLKSMADSLAPYLRDIRQQEFYADPRFHTSIGWALLDYLHPDQGKTTSTTPVAFPTIPHLPLSLLPTLIEKYSAQLASVGKFDVEEVTAKIGKDVYKWRLEGRQ
jgi:U6 snRNA phosphodiesterase